MDELFESRITCHTGSTRATQNARDAVFGRQNYKNHPESMPPLLFQASLDSESLVHTETEEKMSPSACLSPKERPGTPVQENADFGDIFVAQKEYMVRPPVSSDSILRLDHIWHPSIDDLFVNACSFRGDVDETLDTPTSTLKRKLAQDETKSPSTISSKRVYTIAKYNAHVNDPKLLQKRRAAILGHMSFRPLDLS